MKRFCYVVSLFYTCRASGYHPSPEHGSGDYHSRRYPPSTLPRFRAILRTMSRIPHARERKGSCFFSFQAHSKFFDFGLYCLHVFFADWRMLNRNKRTGSFGTSSVSYLYFRYTPETLLSYLSSCTSSPPIIIIYLKPRLYSVPFMYYLCSSYTYMTRFFSVSCFSLSWADTAASTFGRAFGALTPKLPARVPILRLPLAPRKSVAGFIAGSITGACIAVGFWTWFVSFGDTESSWHWGASAEPSSSSSSSLPPSSLSSSSLSSLSVFYWVGMGVLGVVSGLVSGVAEALGTSPPDWPAVCSCDAC